MYETMHFKDSSFICILTDYGHYLLLKYKTEWDSELQISAISVSNVIKKTLDFSIGKLKFCNLKAIPD